ncbi:MAG: helix-turn-helix domain-containing protein [Lachnospiraceae bacterium]|nr:helix-turn-helix domain-containing protein [Lachnospiraceae bacterium]
MDNTKTGSFIREKRKEKGLTQKDIAEILNVTDRAVSKWERGLCAPDIALLEPLSKILEVSISDLISGESQVEHKNNEDIIVETINYSNREMTRKTKRLKKKLIIVSFLACFCILLFLLFGYSSVIFQRGNPVPYLIAANKIDETHRFVKVNDGSLQNIYISKKKDQRIDDFLKELEDDCVFELTFKEQLGSIYEVTDGQNITYIESEIYLGKYIVWSYPNSTLPY